MMAGTTWSTWRERLVFLMAGIVILLVGLLPLGNAALGLSWPDLLYCMVIGWVWRRPELAPLPLIVVIGLLADLVSGRPLGLWTLLLVLGSEFFRGRAIGKGLSMRLVEWFSAASVFAVLVIAYKLVLAASFSASPPASKLALHVFVTSLAYPVVVAFLYWVLNIREPLPSQRSRSLGRMA